MTIPAYHARLDLIMFCEALSTSERMILIAINQHLNNAGEAWPGQLMLQKRTGLGERQLRCLLKGLESRGYLTRDRSQRRSTTYTIQFSSLDSNPAIIAPRQSVPLNYCTAAVTAAPTRQSLPVTPAVIAGHPGSDCRQTIQEPSKNNLKNLAPLQSPKETTDEQAVKKAGDKPKRKRLTLEEIQAVPVPEPLASLEGFAERWAAWVRIRQRKSSGRWTEAPQVESMLRKLARAYTAGKDVLGGLEAAYENSWQGLNPSWLNDRATDQLTADDAWQRLLTALGAFARLPEAFDRDQRTHTAIVAGLVAAANLNDADPLRSWRTLRDRGGNTDRDFQRRRFQTTYITTLRSAS